MVEHSIRYTDEDGDTLSVHTVADGSVVVESTHHHSEHSVQIVLTPEDFHDVVASLVEMLAHVLPPDDAAEDDPGDVAP